MLEHSADRDALDDRGRTPFDWLGQAVKSVDRAAVRNALKTGKRASRGGRATADAGLWEKRKS